jgi:replicative DNA helicase
MVRQQLSAPLFILKRRARILARDTGIPLNEALDQIARNEGFQRWSLLAAKTARVTSNSHLPLSQNQLEPGDLILVAARPGHGKTTVSLELLLDAASAGRHGVFFTLEYNDAQARDILQTVASRRAQQSAIDQIDIDSSDDISAPYIIERLSTTPPGTVIVIDYLQLLDQKRTSPDLQTQLQSLKHFATTHAVCMIFISQVHRSFDLPGDDSAPRIPALTDVRLPNPVDLTAVFNKTCFLHNKRAVFSAATNA